MSNPTGPTVIVVGGSSGLGKVVARRWARDGYRVAIVSRNIPAFIGESDSLHHFPADLVTLSSDAANQLAERIISSLGKITYVMFCQRYRGTQRNLANEMAVSITSTDLMIQAFRPHFVTKGDRAIAAIGSVYADFVGSSQPLSYHVVKAALNALVRFYAVVLGPDGIRVNSISPLTYLKDESRHVYLNNPKTLEKYSRIVPLGRMPEASECANTLLYLCSSQASFVSGQVLYVDGGLSVVWPEELA